MGTTATAETTDLSQTRYAPGLIDEVLLEGFAGHVAAEDELLEAYAAVAETAPEHIRYLIGLVLDDEARHHRLFLEMLNRVRTHVDAIDYEPQVPGVPYPRVPDAGRDELLAVTERLLRFERDDAKALKRLQRDLRPVRDTTLFGLLVELMELDTQKHVRILEFIQQSAKRPR